MHFCRPNTSLFQFLRSHALKLPATRLSIAILAPVLFCGDLQADQEDGPPPVINPTTVPELVANIDNAHVNASEVLGNFASQLDNFFGEEVTSDVANKTRATIRLDFSNPTNDDFSTTAKLKLRLVLPRSQQRVRLLLDLDERDDDESVEALVDEDIDREFSFAFRFIRNATENTRFNVDLGARRFDQSFQSFARLRVKTNLLNDDGWSFSMKNDIRQYYNSGYAVRTGVDFWHVLDDDPSMIFRSSSNFKWEKIRDGARIDQRIGVYKKLKRKSLLAFEVLAGYDTSPEENESHYEGHTARIRYRKNFHRPWFHYELWPSVSWLSQDDGGARFGGLVRMEVQFGKL